LATFEVTTYGNIWVTAEALCVSNGSIYGLPKPEQIDGIIWERQRGLPAIEVGNTAVVAPQAVRGIVEVKSSCDPDLAGFGLRLYRLTAKGAALQDIMGAVTSPPVMGLIIWSESPLLDVRIATHGAAVSLFFRSPTGNLEPNPEAMPLFIRFLMRDVLGVPVPHPH
jgi:hypothetical protein